MIVDKKELITFIESMSESIVDTSTLASKIQYVTRCKNIHKLIADNVDYFNATSILRKDFTTSTSIRAYMDEFIPHFKFPRRYGLSTAIVNYITDIHYNTVAIVPYDTQRIELLNFSKFPISNSRIITDIESLRGRTKPSLLLVDLYSHMSAFKQDNIRMYAIENNIPIILFN